MFVITVLCPSCGEFTEIPLARIEVLTDGDYLGSCEKCNVSIKCNLISRTANNKTKKSEIIRQSVALIKSRFTRWGGSVVLPADSVIEDCVKDILSLSGYNAPVVKSN